MNLIRKLFFFILSIGIVSCNGAKKVPEEFCDFENEITCEALECVKSSYPLIRYSQPQLIRYIPDFNPKYGVFFFKEKNRDTLLSFQVHYYHDTSLCYVLDYHKTYHDSLFNYSLLINSADTAYFFKENKTTHDTLFLIGEYHYKGQYGLFSKKESEYYYLHADSLDQVRGDNLPALPELVRRK